ncbi:carboxysome shell carbonic anhydrase [Lamprobacter modestohalophilus]|uniref:carboxysome shell carbonic anhydrase n=1 Tax=Lamprobacter modestohalophilus TaxID=1064514 RepID=UPI002ADEBF57|nr:carboxysome shell carbonic anhydrase [Lamprobacter modestohalophilus]MEA1051403.1 carboxysome shell carbonic anhydrase [Lamprobacter modestohalophilus]
MKAKAKAGRASTPSATLGVRPEQMPSRQVETKQVWNQVQNKPQSFGFDSTPLGVGSGQGLHPLTDAAANARLYDYESSVKHAFDNLVPVLKQIASERCEPDFVARAQSIARAELGFELPAYVLEDTWVTGLDMRRLFAACVFETYHRVSDRFFTADPLGGRDGKDFERFLLDCGFHLMDVTPCADGRLAHAISYVLRLPYGRVRRKSYAGSLFDIENTVEKWVETELTRFREGRPNTADSPTRYLKVVMYHGSSVDPVHQGCAAHGSDDAAAASAGLERLRAFRQAIENSFCCGASVDLLLVGLDTDTDAIRVHVPDADGYCDLEHWLDAAKVYEITRGLSPAQARERIKELVRAHAPSKSAGAALSDGLVRLIVGLIENNLSQIDYVRQYHGGSYADIGHAERFIGAGIGFEEIQLRNLTYFAYLSTVEEGAKDIDVGIKIFTGLNVNRGLPVPVIVRHDYHGGVPGARERAVEHCERIAAALKARYPQLCADGMLHCLRAVRDCDAAAPIEIVGSSLQPAASAGH